MYKKFKLNNDYIVRYTDRDDCVVQTIEDGNGDIINSTKIRVKGLINSFKINPSKVTLPLVENVAKKYNTSILIDNRGGSRGGAGRKRGSDKIKRSISLPKDIDNKLCKLMKEYDLNRSDTVKKIIEEVI